MSVAGQAAMVYTPKLNPKEAVGATSLPFPLPKEGVQKAEVAGRYCAEKGRQTASQWPSGILEIQLFLHPMPRCSGNLPG